MLYAAPYRAAYLNDLLDALPQGLREAALDMADRLRLPVDLIIFNILSALCSVLQGSFDYENMEGSARPISENMIIVGPKTAGKSKADRAVFDGLREFDKEIADTQTEVKEAREFETKMWREKETILLSRWRKATAKGLPTDEAVNALENHSHNKPKKLVTWQFFYEKTTLAGMEKLISSRPGISFTIRSDEGSKFAESGPLAGPGIVSQGWDGTSQSKSTAHGSYRADNYRMSLRLDFQPEAFQHIFLKQGNEQEIVGFAQRCLYYEFLPPGIEDIRAPDGVKSAREKQFLSQLLHAAKNYAYNPSTERTKLQFSEKAKGAWPYINDRLKETSQLDGPLFRMPAFQRRLMEHTERIACALHLGELMYQGSDILGKVSETTLSGASIVVKYYSQHTARLFYPTTLTQQEIDAYKLQTKIRGIFDLGVQYIIRNKLLATDIVQGKKRFDAAMDLVLAWGFYTTISQYRQGSHKTTQVIVMNNQDAIRKASQVLLPPSK